LRFAIIQSDSAIALQRQLKETIQVAKKTKKRPLNNAAGWIWMKFWELTIKLLLLVTGGWNH
jgi:hypothetical protein